MSLDPKVVKNLQARKNIACVKGIIVLLIPFKTKNLRCELSRLGIAKIVPGEPIRKLARISHHY